MRVWLYSRAIHRPVFLPVMSRDSRHAYQFLHLHFRATISNVRHWVWLRFAKPPSRCAYSPLPSEERALKGEGAGVRANPAGHWLLFAKPMPHTQLGFVSQNRPPTQHSALSTRLLG